MTRGPGSRAKAPPGRSPRPLLLHTESQSAPHLGQHLYPGPRGPGGRGPAGTWDPRALLLPTTVLWGRGHPVCEVVTARAPLPAPPSIPSRWELKSMLAVQELGPPFPPSSTLTGATLSQG